MRRHILACCCVIMAISAALFNVSTPRETSLFKQLPVLYEGRIMPLDTLARTLLLQIYGKEKTSNLTATAWLQEVLLNPKQNYQRPLLNIESKAVAAALNLPPRQGHRYTFIEIAEALLTQKELLQEIQALPASQLTPLQQALLTVTKRHNLWFDISRSLAVFSPEPGLTRLDEQTEIFRILPPASYTQDQVWISLWQARTTGKITPAHLPLQTAWQQFYTSKNSTERLGAVKEITQLTHSIAASTLQPYRLKLEVFYNQLAAFKLSLTAYLLAFVAVIFVLIGQFKRLEAVAHIALSTGLLLHLLGIILRVIMMQRAPVATLYESILVTGVVAVGALYWFYQRDKTQQNTGLLLASLVGAVLQFVGLKFATEGDSMGMLVAVLNTNFWLATHVVAMVLGYAFCLVAGVQAQFYLWQRARGLSEIALENALKSMIGMGLIALLFSTLGTVLGGIWADQSWGRFWGWDPKENGALLVILWLILMLHARLKTISSFTFAVGMGLLPVVVALAWFGVNLLGVGLHSYGFTAGILGKLVLFCGAQVLFLVALCSVVWRRGA